MMRKISLFVVAALLSSGAALAVDTGQSTDVTATVPQAVMQNTSPVPNGQSNGPGPVGPDGKPLPIINPTPEATQAPFGGDPNEIISRDDQAVTGTLFKKKVCHTRRDWDEAEVA